MKSSPTMAQASSRSRRTGLSMLPECAAGSTMSEWFAWIAWNVEQPGMMAFAPPE